MGVYSRLILPWLCDLTLRSPNVAKHRQELLVDARGEILEIGFGTGLNLPHYPQVVRKITAVDPNPGMLHRAKSKVQQSGIEVDERLIGGEQLPFDEAAFDCVVSTFTLCSVQDVDQALGEIWRVLKPGGTFLFLEHGLSPDPKVQKWQRRLNRIQRYLAGNCHLDREIKALVTSQSFAGVEVSEFYLEQTPKTHGYIYQGVAKK